MFAIVLSLPVSLQYLKYSRKQKCLEFCHSKNWHSGNRAEPGVIHSERKAEEVGLSYDRKVNYCHGILLNCRQCVASKPHC